MNQINKQTEVRDEVAAGAEEETRPLASPSRRRLIKLGTAAVPVVATLTSRPAFAWHCMSPAAWGSIVANPNTSLKTNAGHQTYVDETWHIEDWRDNNPRSQTGQSNPPWKALKRNYSALKIPTTTTGGTFDYTKVTIGLLSSVTGVNVAGAQSGVTVKTLLTSTGSEFQKRTIVAQLNHLLLSAGGLGQCVPLDSLKDMAAQTYSPSGPGGTSWSSEQINKYLSKNWIARSELDIW